jgi:sec-independent protein translocase protein TatA
MFGLGFQELVIILIIIVIVFGAGKLPDLGKGLGQGIKNFKKAVSGQEDDDDTAKKEINDKK